MGYFPICKNFGIKVVKKDKKYIFQSFTFCGKTIIGYWELFALFLSVLNDFSRKELEKDVIYSIGYLNISRVQKNKRVYLKIDIENVEPIFLNQVEVKFFPSIANRVIARCDILMRDNEYKCARDEYLIETVEGEEL